MNSQPFVVNRITFKYTKLIDAQGTYHNSVQVWDAKKSAESIGLQLVCFTPPQGDNLPLCRIIDYGKWKYNNEKQQKKVQQEQKHETKEIQFSPHISENDISHKVRNAIFFLEKGNNLILNMKVFGRDLSHMDLAESKMSEIISQLENYGKLISRKTEGGRITVKMIKLGDKK